MDEAAVRAGYDAAAEAYAQRFVDELDHKPLDRALLAAFAEQRPPGGLPVADLGCGPGHVARHLARLGAAAIGIDLSPAMVAIARRLTPDVDFRVGSMLALDAPDGAWAGIVALYSIIHLDPAQIPVAFGEYFRVLCPGGLVLVSFHAGDEVRHVDDFMGQGASLDFRFLQPAEVTAQLEARGFEVVMQLERRAYEPLEVGTRRAYVITRKPTAEMGPRTLTSWSAHTGGPL